MIYSDSNSWFIQCNHLLHKYNLPNIYNLKQHTNSKEELKEGTKHKIDTHVHQSWIEKGSSKSSLIYINLHDCSVGRVHWCWRSTDHINHAFVKVKILTGVYISNSVTEPNLTNMLSVRFAVFVMQLWRIGYTLYLSALVWILSGRNI